MKLIVVTMVKNEEIFIESSIRYWFTFADQIILFDHYSTDGTMNILQDLIAEYGERLVLFNPYLSIGIEKQQALVTNAMTEAAFLKYKADFVIPLDADEYPCLTQGGSLREFFCALPQNSCYMAYWIPFAPPENDRINSDTFAPLAFNRKKRTPMPEWEKTIITRECYEQYRPLLTKGNHRFRDNGKTSLPPRENLTPKLYYAHYPCRGKTHYIIKNLHGWIANYSDITWTPGTSLQYQLASQQIVKENGAISQDILDWYALSSNGMTGESIEDIKNCLEIIDPKTLFPEILIKYTPKYIINKEPIISLFESAMRITEQYRNNCEELAKTKKTLAQTEKALAQNEKILEGVLKSRSWKITAPLRYCTERFHRK